MVVGKVIRWHIAFALLVAVLLDGGVELSHGAYLRTVVYPTTAYYPTSLVENDDDGGGLPLG
jgi:hypothetical protein